MTTKPNFRKIGVSAGIMTAGGLMMFFILMKYLHLAQMLELRALNFLILLTGIIIALNKFKKQNDNHIKYFEGFGLGMLTALVSTIIFAVFIGVYLSFDSEFMGYIVTHGVMGNYLNPSACALVILIEGVISGLLISFGAMQYYRKFEIGMVDRTLEKQI